MITKSLNHPEENLTVELIAATQLSVQQIDAWSAIQQSEPELESPFFRPEFTRAIAKVQGDVEVAILHRDNSIVGFFPFHRTPSGVGLPVGRSLCDFQGVIVGKQTEWAAEQLIQDAGLCAWHFNHVIDTQTAFRPYRWIAADSPYLNLSDGFEAYRASRKMARSDVIAQTNRKARKIHREVGPLRFVPHATEPEVLEQLIQWKTQQYHQLNVTNYLAADWIQEFISHLVQIQDIALCGMLSAVYAGEQLVAVHLGLRSNGVLHWWFPTYNPRYSKYSPGLILLLELAKAAESLGLRRIDLGRGGESYKTRFMSGATQLGEGSVDLRPVRNQLRKSWCLTRELVRNSRFRVPVQRLIRHSRAWLSSGQLEHKTS